MMLYVAILRVLETHQAVNYRNFIVELQTLFIANQEPMPPLIALDIH
jgi:hypothetical protein